MKSEHDYVIDDVIEEMCVVHVEGVRVLTHAGHTTKSVVKVVDVARQLLRSRRKQFSVKQAGGRAWFQETELGERFRACLRVDIAAIRRQYPSHRFNPLFELFERYQDKCAFAAFRPSAGCVRPLNMFVRAIREEAKRAKLTLELEKDRKARRRNRLKLESGFSKLRKCFSRILVVRVELGYRCRFGPGGVVGARVPYETVRKHRAAFLRYLSGKAFKGKFLWYAWKQESAFEKGHHTHVVAVFNGRELRNDVALGFLLGKHWTDTITGGQGTAFNCNHHKERRYREVGIGRLKRDDDRGYEALYAHVITYLTKLDEYFRFDVPGNNRAFGTSQLKAWAEP